MGHRVNVDRFRIELDPDGALREQLARAIAELRQPTELLENIGAVLEANVQRRFDRQEDPQGNAWQPLAASTLKGYERKFKGNIPGSLLERTRRMRDSLTYNVDGGTVEVGFSDRKALWHELGTKRMPRRGMLTADPEGGQLGQADEADVQQEIEAFLAGLL